PPGLAAAAGAAPPPPPPPPPRPPPPPANGLRPPAYSQVPTEKPCHPASVPAAGAGAELLKWTRRVCVPASASIFNVFGSCHEMRSRVGTRMIAGAAYDLHALSPVSFAGSHWFARSRAACVTGTLETSPFGGVIMRHRQSSVTTETQVPVRSTA